MPDKTICLSFDIEEFDTPLEYGGSIGFDKQIRISIEGTHKVLDILDKFEAKATFFSTVVFAQHAPDVINRINREGHELASHAYYHSKFQNADLATSKKALEELSGMIISGFRMPRMMNVDNNEIRTAGYTYNSSVNPVYLPGRYNHYFAKRTMFIKDNVVQIPASATPFLRIPLFWLSFHHLPLSVYKTLCWITMQTDGYLNLYFHPWEFCDLHNPAYKLSYTTKKNCGTEMTIRMKEWIQWAKNKGYMFKPLSSLVKQIA